MRIQHNLPALNSHRNLGVNNNHTSKNLEKLSSGYRVNRAGDDAAGLAISEKMRGQIRGLAMAEQNTSMGINLIQTAEGGLNETHAILQRMRELAVQSSNGTFQNEDREQLTLEYEDLKSEIDRISTSTHYNGIKLLDGSLGSSGKVPTVLASDATGAAVALADVDATANKYQTTSLGGALAVGDTVTFNYKTADGTAKSYTIAATAATDKEAAIDTLISADTSAEAAEFLSLFKVTGTDDAGWVIEAKELGAGKAEYLGAEVAYADASPSATLGLTVTNVGKDAGKELALSDFPTKFEIDGKKFQLVSDLKQLDKGYEAIIIDTDMTNAYLDPEHADFDAAIDVSGDIASIAEQLKAKGYNVGLDDADPAAATALQFFANEGQGLVFQIGANGGDDQRVRLNVNDMGAGAIGLQDDNGNLIASIAGSSIGTIEDANAAIKTVDGATNMVSSQRASLGALQNRLEHTMNNLGVTKENLTASESTIRDVDMAAEMMDFTKNNILSQAAQAMLAQANQLPQGVLQLLR